MQMKKDKKCNFIQLEVALKHFRQPASFNKQMDNTLITSVISTLADQAEESIQESSCKKDVIQLRIGRTAYADILTSICSRPPESGGILIGPKKTNDVTLFYFDKGAECSGASYSPDVDTLKRKMDEEWLPSGLDLKGFTHSHPGKLDWLTKGDLSYIKRLLEINDDMEYFFAPIVIPKEFRMRPIVVSRENPDEAQEAKLIIIK